MNDVLSSIVAEWGALGILIIGIGWLIYDSRKNLKSKNESAINMKDGLKYIDDSLNNLSKEIKLIDKKVESTNELLNDRIDILHEKINRIPKDNIQALEDHKENNIKQHSKAFDDLIKLGPKLHDIMKTYNTKIGADHMFIGSFHNGNSSLTGIPYYKFDIIAEKFKSDKVERDCEFAHMYKDADILRFNMLPTILLHENLIHYTIPEEGHVELAELDDIIWRRMRGRGIRQIALKLLRDRSGAPSGFLGVVKYDFENMKLNEMDKCAKELEGVYHKTEEAVL